MTSADKFRSRLAVLRHDKPQGISRQGLINLARAVDPKATHTEVMPPLSRFGGMLEFRFSDGSYKLALITNAEHNEGKAT